MPAVEVAFAIALETLAHINHPLTLGHFEFFQTCGDGAVAHPPAGNQTRWGTKYRESKYYINNHFRIGNYITKAPAAFNTDKLHPLAPDQLAVLRAAVDVIRLLEELTKLLERSDAGVMAAEWYIDLWITMEHYSQSVASQEFKDRINNAWRTLCVDPNSFTENGTNESQVTRTPSLPATPSSSRSPPPGPPSILPSSSSSSLSASSPNISSRTNGGAEDGAEDESGDEQGQNDNKNKDDEAIEAELDGDLEHVVQCVAKSAVEGVLVVWNRYCAKFNPGMFVAHVLDPWYGESASLWLLPSRNIC